VQNAKISGTIRGPGIRWSPISKDAPKLNSAMGFARNGMKNSRKRLTNFFHPSEKKNYVPCCLRISGLINMTSDRYNHSEVKS